MSETLEKSDTPRSDAAHDPTAPEILYFEAKKMEKELAASLALNARAICAFCGQTGPKDAENIMEHALSCEKHPLNKFHNLLLECATENEKLRESLKAVSESLTHMKSCRECAEEDWVGCEGGRAAHAALERAEEALTTPSEQRFVRREVLEVLVRAIGHCFWSSDDGKEMRPGTPDDGDAPEPLESAWRQAENELARTAPEIKEAA